MKLFGLLTFGALVNGQTPQQSQMMKRFSRTERFLNKWINDNVDSRYKRVRFNQLTKEPNYKKNFTILLSFLLTLVLVHQVDCKEKRLHQANGLGLELTLLSTLC